MKIVGWLLLMNHFYINRSLSSPILIVKQYAIWFAMQFDLLDLLEKAQVFKPYIYTFSYIWMAQKYLWFRSLSWFSMQKIKLCIQMFAIYLCDICWTVTDESLPHKSEFNFSYVELFLYYFISAIFLHICFIF